MEDKDTGKKVTVLAHAPALDVGGLCVPGAHVRMTLMKPGGKTSHSIQLVRTDIPASPTEDPVWVGCHPALAERCALEAIRAGLVLSPPLSPLNGADEDENKKKKKKKEKTPRMSKTTTTSGSLNHTYTPVSIKSQYTVGDSRVDFLVNDNHLVEVKGCVCADYSASAAPEKRDKGHCVVLAPSTVTSKEYHRSGLFPWGKVGQEFEGQKVVSARAIKHVRNLANLQSADMAATVLFVLNRADCHSMRPCHEACPVFALELSRAHAGGTGVGVVAFRVDFKGSQAFFDGIVPVHGLEAGKEV